MISILRRAISSRLIRPIMRNINQNYQYTTQSKHMKVAVIGAAGDIGQPLALMLKQSNLVDELALHDIKCIDSIATELAFIDTKAKVTASKGNDCIKFSLQDAKVVVILVSADASSLSDDGNIKIIVEIAEMCSRYCPQALFAIATEPIHSTVPIFSEVMKKNGKYSPNAIFGITTLNVIRANTFVAEVLGLEPECVVVPVVGGNTEQTIVPLLSQAKPINDFTLKELDEVTTNIKKAQANLMLERNNARPVLSSSFAIARFTLALMKGLLGEPNVIEYAFVRTLQFINSKYFAGPILLGPAGMERNIGVPSKISDFEQCQIDAAIKIIADDVKKSEKLVGVTDPPDACDTCIPEPKVAKCPSDWCERQKTTY